MNLYICAKSVLRHVLLDVQQHLTRSHVCSTATIVVISVCVYHLEHMDIRMNVLVTITGRLKKADQNVLDSYKN